MPAANEVLERLTRVNHSLCSVHIQGNPAGTGFLVGPETVLTNYHVIEKVLNGDGKFKNPVSCVFDHVKEANGSIKIGMAFEVAECLDWSPYGPAEVGERIHDPMPTEDELDYALLRLAESVGNQPVPGHLLGKRGWVDVWDTPWDVQPPPAADAAILLKGNPVTVIQHPLSGPQIFESQSFIGENALRTRMLYDYMTAPGSSGSPCLNRDFKLFALHHLGDSHWNLVRSSQGIPIKLIRERISRTKPSSIPKYDVLADATQQAPWSGFFSLMKQYPEARRAIAESKPVIKQIGERIEELRLYKTIHDVLQSIQGHVPQLQEAMDNEDQKASSDGIRRAARTMLGSWRGHDNEFTRAKALALEGRLRDMKWTDELSQAFTTVVKSGDYVDKLAATQIIKKHLRFQSPELNGDIRQILKKLPVEQLLDAFTRTINAMDLKDLKVTVESGPTLLRSLWDTLNVHVADHDTWQDVENDLIMMAEGFPIEDKTGALLFQRTWERMWSKAGALCEAHPTEPWSVAMQECAADVAVRAKAAQWDHILESFELFQAEMTGRFSQVDKSLLTDAEQIIRLGNPLSALVEASL